MNNYISAEEFLKQDDEVQRQFKELCDHETVLYDYLGSVCYGEYFDKVDYTPLLQINQLIEYIEKKTDCKIECSYYNAQRGYDIYIRNDKVGILCIFQGLGDNLLKALWKVAIQIVEED